MSTTKQLRTSHLVFTFSLVSAALARIVMQILGTRLLDPMVANAGVVIAAIAGLLTGLVLHALRDRSGWRRRVWLIVPIAGAIVGMTMQGLLLVNRPEPRIYVIASGITSNHPVEWVIVGAPFGILPALVAGGILYAALWVSSRGAIPAQDARERMVVPLAGGCAILHAIALAGADGGDIAIVILVLALAVLALGEVFLSDRRRASWLHGVFNNHESRFAIENITTLQKEAGGAGVPLAVGGIDPALVVVGDVDPENGSYRRAARAPYASVAATLEDTLRPLRRRGSILAALLVTTAVTTSIATWMR